MDWNLLIKEYLHSWPATISTVILCTILIFVFVFQDEIRKKIKGLMSLGGNKGAKWVKGKVNFPSNSLTKIQSEYTKAATEIDNLKSQKDLIVDLALRLNQELEDTKTALFFERIHRAILNWQYFLLKLGYESPNRRITIQEAVEQIRVVYPDLDQYVSAESFVATLDDLKSINFIDIVKPYTLDTPIIFTDLCILFMQYTGRGNSD